MAKILKQGATVAAILIAAIITLLGLYAAIVGVPQSYISVTDTQEETVMWILYGKLRIAWIG